MQEYVCIHPCFWESLIEEDQVITVDNDEQIPLSVRPFFKSMTEEEVENSKVETEKENEENVDEIERLRAELEAFGKAFDRRWGRAKLENALTLAKRDASR